MNLHRRALLLTGLSITALQWPISARARAVTRPFSLDDFHTLSAQLSGRPLDSLDKNLASSIFEAFRLQGKLASLSDLLDDTTCNPQCAREVLAAWYSGQLPAQSQTTVVGFPQALVWSAAAFLHAPGTCGGATGYWAEPPLN